MTVISFPRKKARPLTDEKTGSKNPRSPISITRLSAPCGPVALRQQLSLFLLVRWVQYSS